MGRDLKRVPLDFDWPQNVVWPGYMDPFYDPRCFRGVVVSDELKEKWGEVWCDQWRFEPPSGEGFQLWESTSEGSPISPVFETIEALCEWAAGNASTFGPHTATAEEWRKMLDDDFVHHTEGNITFI